MFLPLSRDQRNQCLEANKWEPYLSLKSQHVTRCPEFVVAFILFMPALGMKCGIWLCRNTSKKTNSAKGKMGNAQIDSLLSLIIARDAARKTRRNWKIIYAHRTSQPGCMSRLHRLQQLFQACVESLASFGEQELQGERAVHGRTAHKVRPAAAFLQTQEVLDARVTQGIELAHHGKSVTALHGAM